ncbi:MAG: hypothetical protein JST83_10765 [Bacteroidetes bacterium]|nr:hypothetical protein [Bacteroidota bacterium]
MHRLRSAILLLLVSASPALYAQTRGTTSSVKGTTKINSEIYIPLRERDEVQVIPLVDTLDCEKEYLFRLRFASKYTFSELFFDKGLATRVDSFLSIRPRSARTEGVDTATLRIIGFSNNNRILLYHRFILLPHVRVFPVLNPNKNNNITVGHLALERGMIYSKKDFPDKCSFGYEENGRFNKDNVITGITISLVNRHLSKNFYVKGDVPTDEMIREVHKVSKGTTMYIRLDIKNGRRAKSVWTRFTLDEGGD